MLLKLLAILFLLYFFFKSIGQVVRVIFGGSATTRTQAPYGGNRNQQRKTTRDGLHVDSAPSQQKKKTDFKGGDYVDYEEVD